MRTLVISNCTSLWAGTKTRINVRHREDKTWMHLLVENMWPNMCANLFLRTSRRIVCGFVSSAT